MYHGSMQHQLYASAVDHFVLESAMGSLDKPDGEAFRVFLDGLGVDQSDHDQIYRMEALCAYSTLPAPKPATGPALQQGSAVGVEMAGADGALAGRVHHIAGTVAL